MKDIMSYVAILNGYVNSVVWGAPMLMLIIFTGVYITVRLNFFQLKHYKHISKETFFAIFTKKMCILDTFLISLWLTFKIIYKNSE